MSNLVTIGVKVITVHFYDNTLAAQIGEYVQHQLSLAEARDACTPSDYSSVSFRLTGAYDSVLVEKETSGDITLVFANANKAQYILWIRPDGEGNVSHAYENLPSIDEQLATLYRLTVGLPERSMYGWVEDGRIATLIAVSTTVHRGNVTYPPGLECYALRGEALPAELRMSRDPDDEHTMQWHERFWQYAAEGTIVRLSQRLRDFPDEIYLVVEDRRAFIGIEKTDGQHPILPKGWYDFWHPREEFPGQLSLISWKNCRSPLRSWVR